MEPFQEFCADLIAAWELYKLRKAIRRKPAEAIKVKVYYVTSMQLEALRAEAGASGIALTFVPERATGTGNRNGLKTRLPGRAGRCLFLFVPADITGRRKTDPRRDFNYDTVPEEDCTLDLVDEEEELASADIPSLTDEQLDELLRELL